MSLLTRYRFLRMDQDPDGFHEVITLRVLPGVFASLLGEKERTERYRGSCTVWSRLPCFQRCDTPMEGMLCRMWERALYRRGGPS